LDSATIDSVAIRAVANRDAFLVYVYGRHGQPEYQSSSTYACFESRPMRLNSVEPGLQVVKLTLLIETLLGPRWGKESV